MKKFFPPLILFLILFLFGCQKGKSDASGDPLSPSDSVSSPKCGGIAGVELLDPNIINQTNAGSAEDLLGRSGYASVFGAETQITYKDSVDLLLGKDRAPFSLAFWIKVTGNVQSLPLMSTHHPDDWYAAGFSLRAHTVEGDSTRSYFALQAADENTLVEHQNLTMESVPFFKDQWTHVAITFDFDRSIELSVDMKHVSGLDIVEHPAKIENSNLRLGVWPDTNTSQLGSGTVAISDLCYYDHVLTSEEIRQIGQAKISSKLSLSDLRSALSSLTTHVNSASEAEMNNAAAQAAADNVIKNLWLLPDDDVALESAFQYLAAHAAKLGALFSQNRLGLHPANFGAEDRAAFAIQANLHESLYTPENFAKRDPSFWRSFATSSYFPGAVASEVTRVSDEPVTINGSNVAPNYRILGHKAAIRRFTGLYAPPGELITVRMDPSLTEMGLRLLIGSHTSNVSLQDTLWRFPTISKSVPLDAAEVKAVNPYGGTISVEVPTGLTLGEIELEITGAVKAPYFVRRADHQTSLSEWETARALEAPWTAFESDKFMFEVPTYMVRDFAYDDAVKVLSTWDQAMDAYAELLGRSTSRHRAEYMLMDMQLPVAGALGSGYPMVVEGFDPESIARPDWVTLGLNDIEFPYFVYFHEFGHGHYLPILPSESETIVNLPAVLIFQKKLGRSPEPSIDEAFKYSCFQQMTRDQAAMDWMVTDHFRAGQPMETTWDESNELRYQHRGHAKYVDLADLFGWSVVGQSLSPFAERYYSASVDDFVVNASQVAHANIAPLFEFWGVFPSADALNRITEPASDAIRSRICHYGSVAPRNNTDFMVLYNGFYDVAHQDVYDFLKANFTEVTGNQIITRVEAIVAKYFPGQPCGL